MGESLGLENLIDEISLRMRLLRAVEEPPFQIEDLTEREILFLELLNERDKMKVSEIALAYPKVAASTISMTLTRLWREKGLISKSIDPQDQRITTVELTTKGQGAVEKVKQGRRERFRVLIDALKLDEEESRCVGSVVNRAILHLDEHLAMSVNQGRARDNNL
jgi:DNA-binding MarR family transcriptional regulator